MAFRLPPPSSPVRTSRLALGATFVLFLFIFLRIVREWARTGCIEAGADPGHFSVCGTPATLLTAFLPAVLLALGVSLRWPRAPEWDPYDPAWIVEQARRELPEETALAHSLQACTKALRLPGSLRTVYFVDPRRVFDPRSPWKIQEILVLESHPEGPVEIALLADGRIGSITRTWVVDLPQLGT